MAKRTASNTRLGLFVIAGLCFLVLLLYMIGKNESLFGSSFRLKARFGNVQGLNKGNNVRYLGQQVGTVKSISIINDTAIEVVMLIKSSMKKYIRRNTIAAIASDGLVGNKLVSLSPGSGSAELVQEDDVLAVKRTFDTDEMLQTLGRTNDDITLIVSALKSTMNRINNSKVLWELLNDKTLPANVRGSLVNVRTASARAQSIVQDIGQIVDHAQKGKGSLGAVLTDTMLAVNLNHAILKIKTVGDEADRLALELRSALAGIQNDINNGKGPANALLKDSLITASIRESLDNIRESSARMNEVMEALKQSFLFRGYFKKQAKKQKGDK